MVTARATGTGVSCSAATTRYSRAMSCADGVSPCSGGLRSTHFDASSATRNVRLDRPPEISSARSSPLRGMPTVLEVAVQGVEVKPVERGSHRTCLPPLISRQQVPYVFGAVDGGHVEVALA